MPSVGDVRQGAFSRPARRAFVSIAAGQGERTSTAAPLALQWVVLAYHLAITARVVGAGRLGDIAGRRRPLLGGRAGFVLASVKLRPGRHARSTGGGGCGAGRGRGAHDGVDHGVRERPGAQESNG